MQRFGLGILLVFLSAFGFGLMPIFALFAYRGGVNVVTLLFLRFFIAAICFFVYLLARRTRWHVSRRSMASLFILGSILYSVQSMFYFSAVQYIPASLAALILYLYPVLVALLAAVVEKEQISLQMMAAAVVSLVGIAVVLGAPLDQLDGGGMALAFGAALVYSVYITLGRRVVADVPAVVTSALVAAFAALSFLLFGSATQSLVFDISWSTWGVILGVVAFSTLLAMAAFFAGMERIGATRASILSTIEPVITIAFSALLLGESFTWIQAGGAVLVLAAAVCVISQGRQG
jgi:drug/metabolite transporter (DMT)-like permease